MSATPAIYVTTRTGRMVDLLDPQPQQIHYTDIALALSRIPRFNGHCNRDWSVADHSLLVCDLMGPDSPVALRLAALLHDAHEAYIGDIVSPVAKVLHWGASGHGSALQHLTIRIDTAIARGFTLAPELFSDPAVHAADKLALAVEAHHLMPPSAGAWSILPALPEPVPALPKTDQMAAQNRFIIRLQELMKEHRAGAAMPVAVEGAEDA